MLEQETRSEDQNSRQKRAAHAHGNRLGDRKEAFPVD